MQFSFMAIATCSFTNVLLSAAIVTVVSGFGPCPLPSLRVSQGTTTVRTRTTPGKATGAGLSPLFVADLGSDLPEIDFDLDDIPAAADFIEPLVPKKDSVPPLSSTPRASAPAASGTFSKQQQFNQQPDYGKGKDMPNTYVRCGTCSSHFAIRPEDLGERGKGRRLECCVCGNTWFQSKDRIMTLRPGMELVTLPKLELERVALNKAEGKPANFVGDAKLYVGNLAFECSEEMIYDEFSKLGNVGEISMVYDNETGRPRGFAFVTMRTQEDANKVMQAMNGFQIMGRELSIREANN